MTVSELARALDLNKSTVHEHLAKLVDGGLIRRDESPEREWVYYELTKTARYVLQPASARFVLLGAMFLVAGLAGLVLLHFALAAGQGLAVQTDEPLVPAGQAHVWDVEVTRAGFLGLREPAGAAELYLLSSEQAADFQLSGRLPPEVGPLGPQEGLRTTAPGKHTFQSILAPGVHYLVAREPGRPAGLFPLRAEAVQVEPRAPTVLMGIDPPQVEVAVRFLGQPVAAGLVEATDGQGRELARVPVLNGKAVLPLGQGAEEVRFRFKAPEPGSAFADAHGRLQAPRPHVAFEPAVVPLLATTEVRVVVDDPAQGPRAGAPVSVVRAADGSPVASATTNATGSAPLALRLNEPGELILKAGDIEVGRLVAKPGLRLWVQPGPHWEGEQVRVRSLLLGQEPEPVGSASVVLDGREVGVTDPDGWMTLRFGLGGQYVLEARREGYVAGVTVLDVLPRTGWVLPSKGYRSGFAAFGAPSEAPASPALEVSDAAVLLGHAVQVRARLVNEDHLPRVLRAEFRADGVLQEARSVAAGPGEAVWVAFDYAPPTAGVHALEVNDLPPGQVEALAALPGSAPPRAVPGLGALGSLGALALAGAALALARRR